MIEFMNKHVKNCHEMDKYNSPYKLLILLVTGPYNQMDNQIDNSHNSILDENSLAY